MRRNVGMKDSLKQAAFLVVILAMTLLFFAAGYLAAGAVAGTMDVGINVIGYASFAGLAGFFYSAVFLLRL